MKKRTQILMRLPQNPNTLESKLYTNFKKRAKSHSEHLYIDKGVKPSLFRLQKQGSLFDSCYEVLVVRKSFQIIYDKSENKNEIGFTLVIRNAEGEYLLLTVLKQRKAYYESYKKPKEKG